MEICGAQFRNEGGLWIGDLLSDFGHMEVLLDGTADAPSQEHVAAFEGFAANLTYNILKVRRHGRESPSLVLSGRQAVVPA